MSDTMVDSLGKVAKGFSGKVTLSDETEVMVRVCSGRVLPDALALVAKVAEDLNLDFRDAAKIQDKLLEQVANVSFILQLISKYTKDVYVLLVQLSNVKDVDALMDMPLDDLAAVAIKVVEVNRDFFTSRILPLVSGKLGKTAQAGILQAVNG